MPLQLQHHEKINIKEHIKKVIFPDQKIIICDRGLLCINGKYPYQDESIPVFKKSEFWNLT